WWLGVHYQSPPGFLSSLGLEGRARITPAPRTGEAPSTATAEIIYHLPHTVSAGVRGPAFLDYEAFAAARWQGPWRPPATAPRTGEAPYTATAEIIYHLPQTVSAGVRGPAFLDYEVFAAARWQGLSRQRLIDVRLIDPTEGGGGAPEWFTRYRGFRDVYTFT